MSAVPEPAPDAGERDSRLLDLVDAALKRFGPSIRLAYRTGSGSCVIAFPPPPHPLPPTRLKNRSLKHDR